MDFCNLCKLLMNRERLNLLRKAMMAPCREGLPVSRLADMAWLKPATARRHLRILVEDCGLIEEVRDGRLVSFRARENADDENLRRLVSALLRFFLVEGRGGCDVNGEMASDPPFVTLLPALSNVVRVRMLSEIRKDGSLARQALVARCGLPESDLRRHLRILLESGLVSVKDDVFSFVEPADTLSQLFLSIACVSSV